MSSSTASSVSWFSPVHRATSCRIWARWRRLKVEAAGARRCFGSAPPDIRAHRRVEPISRLKKTLREHYDEKRRRYGIDFPNVYDRDLRRLFSDAAEHQRNRSAASFVNRIRKEVRRTVARWTGEYQYTIKQVIEDIVKRCRELDLHVGGSEEQAKLDFMVMLAVQTMNYIHSGRHRVWL